MRAKCTENGFTLIETLLAVLIISLISAALYSVFSNGIKVWHRATVAKPQYEIGLVLEQLQSDIRNALMYDRVPFKGQSATIEFYAWGHGTGQAKTGQVPDGPVRIQYGFKSSDHTITRKVIPYYDLLNQQDKHAVTRNLAGGIQRCTFQYFKKVNELLASSWHASWSDPCLPDAIKASIEFLEGDTQKSLTKIISVPAGGCAT